MSGGEFSREALRAYLGDEVFEAAEAIAHNAPPASPQAVERVRRIFAAAELGDMRQRETPTADALPRAA